jgi:hypothetical protein
MKKNSFLFIIFPFLSACISLSDPYKEIPTTKIKSISELSGVYNNMDSSKKYALSVIVFNGPIKDEHNQIIDDSTITAIAVNVIGEDSVSVKAIKNDCYVFEKTYTQGKDFELKNGEILLNTESELVGFKSGAPALGFAHKQSALKIGVGGDGIYQINEYATGLAYLMIPFSFGSKKQIKFEKTKDQNDYQKCIETSP